MEDKIGQPLSTITNNCRKTKLVNHYQQLTKIAEGKSWSTINNNYQQLTEDKIGQPLPTIIQN